MQALRPTIDRFIAYKNLVKTPGSHDTRGPRVLRTELIIVIVIVSSINKVILVIVSVYLYLSEHRTYRLTPESREKGELRMEENSQTMRVP